MEKRERLAANRLRVWYGNTTLCSLPDEEFLAGSCLDRIFKLAGFCESPRAVVNTQCWWNVRLEDLANVLGKEQV